MNKIQMSEPPSNYICIYFPNPKPSPGALNPLCVLAISKYKTALSKI